MKEVVCIYKDETYSVREDGTVLRHSKPGRASRPLDNNWTFGKENKHTGYFEIASVPIHRIVATAFKGERPSKAYVVDHIDTNKKNNRPDNLRWVTRLENILLNPITAKRIAIICGSVEAFLAEPTKFKDKFPEPNYKWMCTVSSEEAQASLENLLSWAKNDKHPKGGTLNSWILNRTILSKGKLNDETDSMIQSNTVNAAQRNWQTPSEFPCCPLEYDLDPMKQYVNNLKEDAVFCQNHLYKSLLFKVAFLEKDQLFYVLTRSESENSIKPWALAKVTFENSVFIHYNLGTFFTQAGAERQFCIAQGLEWNGEESIDDYC